MRNPIFFYLLLIFLIVNVLDTVTALFILPGEANPIYLLTGSIWPVVVGKIIIVGFYVLLYRRNVFPSNFVYYNIMLILLLGILLITLGVTSNLIGISNPEALEEASKIPAQQKANQYFSIIGVFALLPYILSLLSFKFWEWSLKHTKIDKQYYKKKRWWEL